MTAPATPETAAGVLVAAAGLIDTRGWWRDEYEGPNGELCAIGALRTAVGARVDDPSEDELCEPFPPVYWEALSALTRLAQAAVEPARGHGYATQIVQWNDVHAPELGGGDYVTSSMRAAAETADADGAG